ncbi:MAG: sulfatase-like hydrolase/transferase [Chlamydiota bacterium]
MSVFHEKKTLNFLGSFSLAAVIWFYFAYGGFTGYFDPTSCKIVFLHEVLFLSIVTVLFFVTRQFFLFSTRKILRIFSYFLFLAAFLLVLREIEMSQASIPSTLGYKIKWLIFSVLFLVSLIFFFWKKSQLCARIFTLFFALLTPFGVWNVAISFKNLCFAAPLTLAPVQAKVQQPKIIWLLFDEMDPFFVFSYRPASIHLPELDRLKDTTFYASQVYQLANYTMTAIPSLTIGKKCQHVMMLGPNSLQLFFKNLSFSYWESCNHIFSEAYRLGRNPAVFGWYHPYDFILKGVTYFSMYGRGKSCSSFWGTFKGFLYKSFYNPLVVLFPAHFHTVVGATPENQTFGAAPENEDVYFSFLEDIKRVLSDDKYNFVFVHFPIPHAHNIKKFSSVHNNPLLDGYYNNLLLVDQTVGIIRQTLGEKWNSSLVLVTSDHWLRFQSLIKKFPERQKYLVPFMVKMPFQTQGYTYDKILDGTIIYPFFLEVMKGKLITDKDLISFIERENSAHREPYKPH